MSEIAVIETSLEESLQTFSQYLWKQGISHRIVEENQRQYLLVGSRHDAEQVANAYRDLRAGKLSTKSARAAPKKVTLPPLKQAFKRLPVTLSCVVLSIIGYLLYKFSGVSGWDAALFQQLTFFKVNKVGVYAFFSVPAGQYWRLITPIFLHFSLMHIVFNMLWLWDLGRRVELLQGSVRMLGIVLVIGMGSNLAQFLYADAGIFGGMSGVIYGLLGYGWIWSAMCPQLSLQIPRPVLIFMLAWMVLCIMGFTSLMGLGDVANAAHVGGLVMGMLMGLGAACIEKMGGDRSD